MKNQVYWMGVKFSAYLTFKGRSKGATIFRILGVSLIWRAHWLLEWADWKVVKFPSEGYKINQKLELFNLRRIIKELQTLHQYPEILERAAKILESQHLKEPSMKNLRFRPY